MNQYVFTILEAQAVAERSETEQELAALYAAVDNQFWLVEDEEYDWPEGTDRHAWAVEHTEQWCELRKRLEERIFTLLQEEGVVIPKTGRIEALKPFMKRNGYEMPGGWWHRTAAAEGTK